MSRNARKCRSLQEVAAKKQHRVVATLGTTRRQLALCVGLVLFGVGPIFLWPAYSTRKCPEVDQTAYRGIPLEVRTTDVHGKFEYCAFPYQTRRATRFYDATPWSDFCGATRADVETRVTEFRLPALEAEQQCNRAFGDALRRVAYRLFHPFAGS